MPNGLFDYFITNLKMVVYGHALSFLRGSIAWTIPMLKLSVSTNIREPRIPSPKNNVDPIQIRPSLIQ